MNAIIIKIWDIVSTIIQVFLLILRLFGIICGTIFKLFVPVEEKSAVGEIVLVTGAGHGIGKEVAIIYASLGATVVCWDLNKETNETTVNEIKKTGRTAVYAYQCDVSNREQILEVADKVKKEVGDVTILINNAGIMPCRPFMDNKPDVIRKIFDVNALAHFWILQVFLPDMIKKNHGHIVAVSSLTGLVGLPNLVPYCASKFAVRGLMEAMSEELRRSSGGRSLIKFTTIYPYMVDTGLVKNPKMKFPSIMSLLSPQQVASEIVATQRRGYRNRSVPAIWYSFNQVVEMLPDKAKHEIINFFEPGVDADN